MAYVGWAFTIVLGLPLLFVLLNCAADWVAKRLSE